MTHPKFILAKFRGLFASSIFFGILVVQGPTANAASDQALAQQEASSWNLGLGIGPNISQIDAVGDDLKSSVGGAIWLSRVWGERSRFDISFDYFKFSGDGQNYPALNLGYGWRFFKDSRLKPFAMIGGGVGQANKFPRASNSSQTAPHLFGRAGVSNLLYGERWNVGLIFDFQHVFMDGNRVVSAQLALPMLTLSMRFGDDPAPVQATAQKIPRRIDPDTDGDGVRDSKDECPSTAKGVRVNSIGCPPKQKIVKVLKVEFETAKDIILPGFMDQVDEFGRFLAENADLNVVIEGHTDSVGSRSFNIDLSQRRAGSVAKALIERHQINPGRIKSVGYGPDKPVDSNETDSGRQKNRRVEAVLSSE